MENQNRLMFLLAAVLLALVAVIVLVKPPPESAEEGLEGEEGEDWAPLVEGLEASRVTRLQLAVAGAEPWDLVRNEQGWRFAAPVQADADDVRVEALVDAFARVEVGAPIDGPAVDFGLEPPTATVTLTTDDGTRHLLQVGRDAPVGWHSYLRLGEDGPVRASRSKLSTSVQTPLVDLRVRTLWSLPQDGVDRLELRSPAAALELERRGGDWWVRGALAATPPFSEDAAEEAAAGPGEAPVPTGEAPVPTGEPPALTGEPVRADPARVEALLQELGAIEATGFVQAPDFHPEALAWQLRATVAGASQVLAAGQTDDGSWVASGPHQEGLVTLDPAWARGLFQPVPQWWAADLVPIDEFALTELQVELGGRRLVASRTEAGWSPPEAGRMVEALGAVRVERGLAPPAAGEPWGRIVLRTPDGARTLRLHQATPEGGRVVVDEAGGPPFPISALELGRLEGALPGGG